jgi:hypothetical protein
MIRKVNYWFNKFKIEIKGITIKIGNRLKIKYKNNFKNKNKILLIKMRSN